jgi:hypothetical protein
MVPTEKVNPPHENSCCASGSCAAVLYWAAASEVVAQLNFLVACDTETSGVRLWSIWLLQQKVLVHGRTGVECCRKGTVLHGEEKYKIRVPFLRRRVLYRLAPHTYIGLLTFSKNPEVKKLPWKKFDIPHF